MRHTNRILGASLALLAVGTLSHAALAQTGTVSNSVAYDSLNAPLNNANLIATQGGQQYLNAAAGAQQVQNGGVGAYNVLNTFAGPNTASLFSSTDVGGGIASTTLLADDLNLQVSSTAFPNDTALQSYKINSLGFLLTNSNASAITVTAHVRIYDNSGFGNTIINAANGNGGFAGNLLGAYDLSPVTLASRTSTSGTTFDSSVTLINALSSATPLTLAGDQFALTGNNYQRTIWVGVFVTSNASTALLNNVGYLAYDPRTAGNPNGNEQFDRGSSADQLYGDRNFDNNGDGDYNDTYTQTRPDGVDVTTAENSALANNGYNYARINPNTAAGSGDTGADVNADRIRQLGQFSGNRPDANLSFFLSGDATYFVVPEPGSLGFALAGMVPFGLIALRRARRKAA